jgi:hypothetical protein
MASVMSMMKQNNARKAEKAFKEILDKADGNANGRVELTDFMDILEVNGVEVIQILESLCKRYFYRWMKMTLLAFLPSLIPKEKYPKLIFLSTLRTPVSGKSSWDQKLSLALTLVR